MNTFLTVPTNILILATALFVLVSNTTFAADKHIPEATEDAFDDTYSDALRELEVFISRTENSQDLFVLEDRVVIYDENLKLLRTAVINPDHMANDKELLMTLRNSSEFMRLKNTTYYIMNK